MRQPAITFLVLASLGVATLAFAAAPESTPAVLELRLPPLRAEPGDPALLTVVAYDDAGKPAPGHALVLEPLGDVVYTNSRGFAHFRFTSHTPGPITYLVSNQATGERLEAFEVVWSPIEWTILPEQDGVVEGAHHRINATAAWAWDGAPAPGLQIYATHGGVTYLSPFTDAAGQTALDVSSPGAQARVYEVWTQTNASRTTMELQWFRDNRANTPPSLGEVNLSFDGRTAIATVDKVFDSEGDRVTLSYAWYVNGTLLPGATARHTVPPLAEVTLAVTPYDGRAAGSPFQVTGTSPPNQMPEAIVEVAENRDGGFTLDARNSTDPERETLTYWWTLPGVTNVSGEVVQLPAATQDRVVKLRVTDPWGATAIWSGRLPATLPDNKPAANASSGSELETNTTVEAPDGGEEPPTETQEPDDRTADPESLEPSSIDQSTRPDTGFQADPDEATNSGPDPGQSPSSEGRSGKVPGIRVVVTVFSVFALAWIRGRQAR